MIGWHGASMLCYVTPKEHLGLPNAEDVKQASSLTRLPRTRPTWRGTAPAPAIATTRLATRDSFSTGTSSLSFHSIRKPRSHARRIAPDDFYKEAKFCSMCGPKFCSMNITQLAEAESGKDQAERQTEIADLLVKVQGA